MPLSPEFRRQIEPRKDYERMIEVLLTDAQAVASLALAKGVGVSVNARVEERQVVGWRLDQATAMGQVWREATTTWGETGFDSRPSGSVRLEAGYVRGVVGHHDLVLETSGSLYKLTYTTQKGGWGVQLAALRMAMF